MLLSIFLCSNVPFKHFFWLYVNINRLPIYLLGCLPYHWVVGFFLYFQYKHFAWFIVENILSQFVACNFTFLMVSFRLNVVNFDKIHIIKISLLWFQALFLSKKFFPNPPRKNKQNKKCFYVLFWRFYIFIYYIYCWFIIK